MSKHVPRVIATVGLHGSASTWAYNIVRELMIAALGREAVAEAYADILAELGEEVTTLSHACLVVKSHHGSTELDAWLEEKSAQIILSVRDPRDAAISMSQRFKAPLQNAVRWVMNDCARLVRLAGAASLTLRYENRPFEDLASVRRIGEALGVPADVATAEAIFERYRTDSVRAFGQRLGALPPERLSMTDATHFDRVTQIHACHIGDARSGKWRDLRPPIPMELTRAFSPYLEALGYVA